MRERGQGSVWAKHGKLYVRPAGEKPIATELDDTPANRAQVRRELNAANKRRAAERKLASQLGTGVPTVRDWFAGGADVRAKETPRGDYWTQWVVAQKNSDSEMKNKLAAFTVHIDSQLGHLPLDRVTTSEVNRFKAYLVSDASGLASDRSRNNILTILSTMLKAAVDAQIILELPTIKAYRYKRPEIEWWRLDAYPRLLAAAKVEGPIWYAAVALAGEAGLRQGEIRGIRWREDVDLVAKVISVNQQMTKADKITPPKAGSTRRIPMTATLHAALSALDVVREGLIIRLPDGTSPSIRTMFWALNRICRRAGLPAKQWHTARHSFGTHSALFGANPWKLQSWLGHTTIEMTMKYVHVASAYLEPLPPAIVAAGDAEKDPDRRVIAMLAARTATELLPGPRTKRNHGEKVERVTGIEPATFSLGS